MTNYIDNLPNVAPIFLKKSNYKLGKYCHIINYHPLI